MADPVLIMIYSILCIVSLFLNGSLLALIVAVTPKSNRNFSILLITHTAFDIFITLSNFSNMCRILILDMHLVWIMHGPCTLISTRTCYLGFDAYLVGVSAVFYINMVSFYARLLILRDGFISRKRIAFLLAVFVSPHVIALAIFFGLAQIPDTQARQLIETHVPQYAYETNVIASDHIFSPGIAYTLFYVCVVIYPAMGGFWKLRATTIAELAERGKQMSATTRALHSAFIKVLTYQSMVPTLFGLSATMFIVIQLCEWRQPAVESISMMIGESPAIVSAIISLTHIPAYRRYVVRLLFRGSSGNNFARVGTPSLRVDSISTVNTTQHTVKSVPHIVISDPY